MDTDDTSIKTKKTKHKKTRRVYSKRDYASGDGMLTTVWGPPMWHYLHTMSFNYPVSPTAVQKRQYRDFIYSLRHVLPCKYCRINLTNNLKKKPLQACHLANRATFSKYIYDLHELVNRMLNKPKTGRLSYCDVRERYEHFRSRCTNTSETPRIFTFANSPGFTKQPTKTRKRKTEKGCTEPLYGKKSKCVINIVPQEDKTATFRIDDKCVKTREPN